LEYQENQETNGLDCLRQLLQQAREALAKHDKATACITEVEPNADGAVTIPGDVFHALGGCIGAGCGSAFVRQPDGKCASRRYRVFVSDHAIAEDLSQLITVCGASLPSGMYDRFSIKPHRDAEGMFYAVLFAAAEPHLIETLTGPDLAKPWRLIRSPFLAVVRCLERIIESEADGKHAVRRDAGAEQGGKGTNRPPATPEAIAQSVKHFYGLLADHVAAVGDQLELAANPLLKPHLPTARIRAFAVRCALQSVPCDGLAGPHNPLAGILPGPVEPEIVLSWVHSLAGGMTSNIRAACTRLAQLMPAVEAWVTGESPASAELIAGWGGARERLFKGVEEAFEMLHALVAQAGGLPRPKDVKRTPAPAEPTDLDDLIDILNAPRDWPPPTVAAELTAAGEKQQPGLTESVEEELCRRRMVPLTTLIRQNNENSYTPGDPEELEIAMEKLGYYTPKYLSMEMEYERSHSEGFSEAHRREESLKQHGRALRMHELDPSLPPVPTFTDNPVVDEKNLWKWCTDAEAPAKPQAGTPGADKVAGPGQGAGHTSQEAKPGTDNGGDSTKRQGKRREPLIPTADERKIAEYYEQSGKAQEAVADELNANWKKLGLKGERFPLSQKKMSEIVKKVNARRMFDKQPQIPTVRKGAPKRMEASKLDLGPRKHKGRGLQQRGNMQWDEKGED